MLGFGRNRQEYPEAQVPQPLDDAVQYEQRAEHETGAPYVLPIPPEELKNDGYIHRVFWPNGETRDLTQQDLMLLYGKTEREIAAEMGYETPPDVQRLEEIVDAQIGLQGTRAVQPPSKEIELSIDKIEGLRFRGDPSQLFGNQSQPQASPVEQLFMSYFANRMGGQADYAAPNPYDAGVMRAEHVYGQDEGTGQELQSWYTEELDPAVSDAEVVPEETLSDDTYQQTPATEQDQPTPNTVPQPEQLTGKEKAASRNKYLSFIGSGAVAAAVVVIGYGGASIPAGLHEHKIWNANVVAYQSAFWHFATGSK